MKKFNIVRPRSYTNSRGEEKTAWDRVGEYIEFERQDGTVNRIVRIPAINLDAQVFEEKPKEAQPQKSKAPDGSDYPEYEEPIF